MTAPDAGPLIDVVVLDLSRALAGPHAAMMLGDLGARVIKVERPGSGDDSRGWGPPFLHPPEGPRESTYFFAANRNKEPVVLDLRDDDDMAALVELVRRADVLIENFRPGVLARLGLDTARLQELNPRLVVLSISGFGHDGPEAQRAGYDQIAQGETGLMSLTGPNADDPQRFGVPITDLLAGMYGAFGVVSALVERERSGRGQVVRTSLLAAGVGVHAYQGTAWTVGKSLWRANGNHHPSISPYGLFRCLGGSVQLACGSEALWRRLCAEFGIDPDRSEFLTNADRVAHRAEVIDELEATFADQSPQQLLERLASAGVPAGRVRTLDEVYAWDQVRSQGLVVDVDHETVGPVQLPGPPLRFFEVDDDAEVEVTRRDHRPPPVLDAHTSDVLAWLAEPAAPGAAGRR